LKRYILRPHLTSSPNFSPLQSAYQQGRSTETALLHILDSAFTAADNKHATMLVALDISAAFDTISHSVLLKRLGSEFGLCGTALQWLRSYLSGRTQFVKLGRHSLVSMPCESGVPQGSILGPLLFTTYVAPIGRLIQSFGCGNHQFADDTQLYVALDAAHSAQALANLSSCSEAVKRWFLLNGLQLNAGKSEVVILGTAHQLQSLSSQQSVSIAGCPLPVSSELKSLGVTIDSRLRFDAHVSSVVKSCTYHTRALRHVRRLMSADTAATIACSIVASRLDYCNSLLHGAPAASIDKLQRAQNALARVLTQSSRRTSAKPLLRQLHWLPVRQRITYKLAVITFKAMKSSSPPYLSSLLQPYVATRFLRSSAAPRLVVQRSRTDIGKRAFHVAAPLVWNSLPDHLRLIDNLTSFKRTLKSELFIAAFDTID
jgi:hypothetical protein